METRFAHQTAEIVALLREGPQTNAALSNVALKYTSRISDARKLGHKITCTRIPGGRGLTMYELDAS